MFHPHRHGGYERRLGLFPRIQQKSKCKHSFSSSMHLMTSFDGNGVGLTFVFSDGGVDAVHDVGANRGFEDCGERNCCAIGGCRTRSKDVDLRTGGLNTSARNFTQILRKDFINASIVNTIHDRPVQTVIREHINARNGIFSKEEAPFSLTMIYTEKRLLRARRE